ncbi:MAG: hypothetical protein ACRBHB_22255 [Arenicella sp.]
MTPFKQYESNSEEIKVKAVFFSFITWLVLISTHSAVAETYWVATNGDDDNGCVGELNACRTIARAVSQARQPGDIVNIKSGTYTTTSAAADCSYFGVPVFACVNGDGIQERPITIQSAPGNTAPVILDGASNLAGIHLLGHDYIIIQNLELANMHTVGIYNGGPPVTNVSDESDFSVGVQVLNNYIHDVRSVNAGSNPGGIRMDNAKDWIVKNNLIHTVCGLPAEGGCRYINAGCIYSYYIWNATVENNECSHSGAFIHWKDHVLDANGNPTLFGSLTRYNLGYNLTYGFYISHGNRDPQSSNHFVTHNIFYNIDSACMSLITDTANGALSVNYVFEHNICDGTDVGILSFSAQLNRSRGNIFSDITGFPAPGIADIYRFRTNAGSENTHAQLDYSDYNIFADSSNNVQKFPRSNMNDPHSTHIYNSLSTWQNALSANNGGAASLTMGSPDTNSIEVHSQSLFVNNTTALSRDYHYADNSPAINFMPDGTNAGPYEIGNEVIGLLDKPVTVTKDKSSILDILPSIIAPSLKLH